MFVSCVEFGIHLCGERVYHRLQFLLDLYHVLLVSLSDQVDCQSNLPKSSASAYPVQVDF